MEQTVGQAERIITAGLSSWTDGREDRAGRAWGGADWTQKRAGRAGLRRGRDARTWQREGSEVKRRTCSRFCSIPPPTTVSCFGHRHHHRQQNKTGLWTFANAQSPTQCPRPQTRLLHAHIRTNDRRRSTVKEHHYITKRHARRPNVTGRNGAQRGGTGMD